MQNRFSFHFTKLILLLAMIFAVSSALFAQGGGQARGAVAPKSTEAFDPHDLAAGGVWNSAPGKIGCSLKDTAYPPDPNCQISTSNVTGNPQVKGAGADILPVGVEMTPWAHDRWMSEDKGSGISGNADPYDQCDPLGFPRALIGYIHPFQVIQTPSETWMIYEEQHLWRLIYTDGRPIPNVADLPYGATWLGFSVGHWDGNDFIVDTVGMNDKTWLDQRGHPHTEDLKLKETYRRADHDTLEASFTINDPKAYTKVFTYGPKKYALKKGADWEMQESFCTLGEQTTFNQKITDPTAKGILPARAPAETSKK